MRRINTRQLLLGGLGVVGVVILWHFLAMTVMRDTSLPMPAEVALAAVAVVQQGTFWTAFGATLAMAVKGFGLALIVGVLLGILIGWVPLLDKATSFIVEFLKPIPPIVIMPLAILVFGPTQQMGEFLVFYGCLLPILYQTAAGVKETDPVALETSLSLIHI